eukprot:scaffold1866_cov277-Pinguiococcus_pyrenoidosus.AAC.9
MARRWWLLLPLCFASSASFRPFHLDADYVGIISHHEARQLLALRHAAHAVANAPLQVSLDLGRHATADHVEIADEGLLLRSGGESVCTWADLKKICKKADKGQQPASEGLVLESQYAASRVAHASAVCRWGPHHAARGLQHAPHQRWRPKEQHGSHGRHQEQDCRPRRGSALWRGTHLEARHVEGMPSKHRPERMIDARSLLVLLDSHARFWTRAVVWATRRSRRRGAQASPK